MQRVPTICVPHGASGVEAVPTFVRGDYGSPELVNGIASEWRALCAEGASDEPFFRPEWVAAYLNAFAPDKTLLLITARVDGCLKAVLPLIREVAPLRGIPVRKLRAAANVHSCRFDVVRAPGAVGVAAIRAIWRFLSGLRGWDVIELGSVPPGSAAEILACAAHEDGFPVGQNPNIATPYIPINHSAATAYDWSRFCCGAHFRQNFRRRLRKAQERYTLSLQRFDTADPAALEAFMNLEASGWKGEEGSAILCSSETRRFYDQVARSAELFGYLALYLLRFDDHVVAAQFGLNYRDRYYCPKTAYDESFASYAPGHLIVGAILCDVAGRGAAEFDFLGPMMPWKAEWTCQTRPHVNQYIFNRGVIGYSLHAGEFRLLPRLRQLRALGARRDRP